MLKLLVFNVLSCRQKDILIPNHKFMENLISMGLMLPTALVREPLMDLLASDPEVLLAAHEI